MSRPGVHLKAAAVENPWRRVPEAAGGGLSRAGDRGRANTIGDRACAALIIGLVVVMVLGWLALGASYVREAQRDGSAAVARIGTITVQHPDLAAAQSTGEAGAVDIAAWMPVWIGVDLVVFLGLGIFLRCEQGRKQ